MASGAENSLNMGVLTFLHLIKLIYFPDTQKSSSTYFLSYCFFNQLLFR